MNMKIMWMIVGVLTVIIISLAAILFATPAHAPTTEVENGGNVQPAPSPEQLPDTALHDRVMVNSPKPGTTVNRDFRITGEAPGNWYFEASFPYKIIAPNGDVLAQSFCQAQSDWMTTKQVPYVCNVQVAVDYAGKATVVLMKDNPSGLPEHEDAIDFQITVK